LRKTVLLSSCIALLPGYCWAAAEPPKALNESTVSWQGKNWQLIDEEGVFVCEPAAAGGRQVLPPPNRPAGEIISRRGWDTPVKCRLVDFVDCTQTDHGFEDDGKSRVLDLPGGKFRVTGAAKGFELTWFAYTVQTADRAGVPHLVVVETPNDRERYTTVSMTVPKGEPWSPPYAGQEAVKVNAMAISQEPLWYEPDVGLAVYTGRELPIDDKPFTFQYVFFPKTAKMRLIVSSSGWAKPHTPESGGAVSRIWVFEILDRLADRLPKIDPPNGRQRHVGLYATHPWYFLAHYGVPPHTPEQRRQSFENMCDLLAFCGMNLIEFNAINGSDRAGRAWYPGSYYKQLGADLLSELPPVAEPRGIDIVPVVTSITAPGKVEGSKPNQYGFSELSFQKHANPKADPRAFEHRPPDPLRQETQRWLIKHLVEIGKRCRQHKNVIGIGFRANGKIGTCYISGEDKSSGETKVYSAELMGYSPWNLSRFRAESKLPVPNESMEAYTWLKADPKRWDQWLDFRCRHTREFWIKARDAIRAIRPDWTLYVLTDLPSEVTGTNVDWPGADSPDAEKVTLDLLRAHGYDPRMFKKDKGILIQRVMMVDMERFFGKWGPPWGSNPERYRDYHEQEFLPDWFRTPAGSATELYHTYWEEAFHPAGEFGPDAKGFGLRTSTGMAKGRSFYRPATFTLRAGDTDTIAINGWQRPVMGHEHDLRRFCRAVRALPTLDRHTGVGQGLVAESKPLATTPADPKRWAARYGDRIAIINDRDEPADLTVKLDEPLPPGKQLRDLATGHVLIKAGSGNRDSFTIGMEEYDIRAIAVE